MCNLPEATPAIIEIRANETVNDIFDGWEFKPKSANRNKAYDAFLRMWNIEIKNVYTHHIFILILYFCQILNTFRWFFVLSQSI